MDSLVGTQECVRSFLKQGIYKEMSDFKSMVDDTQGVDREGNGEEMEKWTDR